MSNFINCQITLSNDWKTISVANSVNNKVQTLNVPANLLTIEEVEDWATRKVINLVENAGTNGRGVQVTFAY